MSVGTATGSPPVGTLLRQWRTRRRLSQLELSSRADVSTRHLSYLETGRSQPSREMVLHLAEELDLPLRDRNRLLLAAGYAPVYPERPLDTPAMATVRAAVRQILVGHEPYPAVVVDGNWNLLDANAGAGLLTADLPESLLVPPVNILRATLHPDGMASRIVNLAEVRAHLLGRLRRQADLSGDPATVALYDELAGYPAPPSPEPPVRPPGGDLVLPVRLRHGAGELAFFSTVATFGTPLEVTTAELMIESFFPADEYTAAVLRAG